jgi:signal transduction histidine kinase
MDASADIGGRVLPARSLPHRQLLTIAPPSFATLPWVAGILYFTAGVWFLLLRTGAPASLEPWASLRGPLTAASGLLLLWIGSDAVPWKIARLAYVAVAVLQLLLAVVLFDVRTLPTVSALVLLALAILAAALTTNGEIVARPGPDAVGLALGAALVAQGTYLLSRDGPAQAIVSSLRSPPTLVPALYLAAGLAIVGAQILVWLPPTSRRAAHLIGGVLVIWAWFFGASLDPLALALSPSTLLRGLVILFLPVLSDWAVRFDRRSLRVRLALTLTTTAFIPPLVILPFVLASVDGSRETAIRQIAFLATVLVAVVSAMGGWLLAGILSRSVVELIAVLRQIGEGDYHIRLSSGGTTEKLRLAQAVDTLADTLSTRLTEREASLAAEHAARQRAEAAVAARDEFLSVASHELKTPVTSVRGFSQLLVSQLRSSGTLDPVRGQRALAIMDAQTARLATLINRVLDLSRIESGRLILDRDDADVGPIVAGVVDALRHVHPDRVINANLSFGVTASIDSARFEQVIMNLLDNALKFSPADTPIDVGVVTRESGVIEIVVRDRGVGIPVDQREKVFERFHQVNGAQSRRGLGLGLYVSKQIVELHGGSIRVDSPVDGGTRVAISLPGADRGTEGDEK